MAIIPGKTKLYDDKAIQKAAAEAKQNAAASAVSAAEAAASAAQAATAIVDVTEAVAQAEAAQAGAEAAYSSATAAAEQAASSYSGAAEAAAQADASYSGTAEIYSAFSGVYSGFAPAFTVLSEYGYVQEAATAPADGSTREAPDFIRDAVDSAFDSRGVTMVSCGAYSDGNVYSDYDADPMGPGSLFPGDMLTEDMILRHQLTGVYSTVSYADLQIKKFATAELWVEIPDGDVPFAGELQWGDKQWLELSAPDTLEAGKGHVFVLRNTGSGSTPIIINYATSYTL